MQVVVQDAVAGSASALARAKSSPALNEGAEPGGGAGPGRRNFA